MEKYANFYANKLTSLFERSQMHIVEYPTYKQFS